MAGNAPNGRLAAGRAAPPATRLTAELEVPTGVGSSRLSWAASSLLAAGGLGLAIGVRAGGRRAKLRLPAGLVVSGEELEEIAHALSLEAERALPRDRHGRPVHGDRAEPAGDPWISRRAAALRSELEGRGAAVGSPPRWRVIVSHDVDHVTTREPSSIAASLLRRPACVPLAAALDPRSMHEAIVRVLEIERRHGVTSWFFLLAGGFGLRRGDARYGLRWPATRELIGTLREAGARIGLHGSYRAGEGGSWSAEARRLAELVGAPIVAHRNHYLRLDPHSAWSGLERAGIRFDMTLGFPDRAGYRVPVAGAFRPWDRVAARPSPVTAIPLVFMDRLHHAARPEATLDLLERVLEPARAAHGCVSILVHPEAFLTDASWFDLYDAMLARVTALGAAVDGCLPDSGSQWGSA